jgi:hypothetical protein
MNRRLLYLILGAFILLFAMLGESYGASYSFTENGLGSGAMWNVTISGVMPGSILYTDQATVQGYSANISTPALSNATFAVTSPGFVSVYGVPSNVTRVSLLPLTDLGNATVLSSVVNSILLNLTTQFGNGTIIDPASIPAALNDTHLLDGMKSLSGSDMSDIISRLRQLRVTIKNYTTVERYGNITHSGVAYAADQQLRFALYSNKTLGIARINITRAPPALSINADGVTLSGQNQTYNLGPSRFYYKIVNKTLVRYFIVSGEFNASLLSGNSAPMSMKITISNGTVVLDRSLTTGSAAQPYNFTVLANMTANLTISTSGNANYSRDDPTGILETKCTNNLAAGKCVGNVMYTPQNTGIAGIVNVSGNITIDSGVTVTFSTGSDEILAGGTFTNDGILKGAGVGANGDANNVNSTDYTSPCPSSSNGYAGVGAQGVYIQASSIIAGNLNASGGGGVSGANNCALTGTNGGYGQTGGATAAGGGSGGTISSLNGASGSSPSIPTLSNLEIDSLVLNSYSTVPAGNEYNPLGAASGGLAANSVGNVNYPHMFNMSSAYGGSGGGGGAVASGTADTVASGGGGGGGAIILSYQNSYTPGTYNVAGGKGGAAGTGFGAGGNGGNGQVLTYQWTTPPLQPVNPPTITLSPGTSIYDDVRLNVTVALHDEAGGAYKSCIFVNNTKVGCASGAGTFTYPAVCAIGTQCYFTPGTYNITAEDNSTDVGSSIILTVAPCGGCSGPDGTTSIATTSVSTTTTKTTTSTQTTASTTTGTTSTTTTGTTSTTTICYYYQLFCQPPTTSTTTIPATTSTTVPTTTTICQGSCPTTTASTTTIPPPPTTTIPGCIGSDCTPGGGGITIPPNATLSVGTSTLVNLNGQIINGTKSIVAALYLSIFSEYVRLGNAEAGIAVPIWFVVEIVLIVVGAAAYWDKKQPRHANGTFNRKAALSRASYYSFATAFILLTMWLIVPFAT